MHTRHVKYTSFGLSVCLNTALFAHAIEQYCDVRSRPFRRLYDSEDHDRPLTLTFRPASSAASLASLSRAAADPSSVACNASHASLSCFASCRAAARAASAAAPAVAAFARSVSRAHLKKQTASRRSSKPASAAAAAPTTAAAATARPTLTSPEGRGLSLAPAAADIAAAGFPDKRRVRAMPDVRNAVAPGPRSACVEASETCFRGGLCRAAANTKRGNKQTAV